MRLLVATTADGIEYEQINIGGWLASVTLTRCPFPSTHHTPACVLIRFIMQVLAGCSHLMIWNDEDVCTNFGDVGALSASVDAPTPVALRILLRVAQSVYREYQRQLFDPNGVTVPGLDDVSVLHRDQYRGVPKFWTH